MVIQQLLQNGRNRPRRALLNVLNVSGAYTDQLNDYREPASASQLHGSAMPVPTLTHYEEEPVQQPSTTAAAQDD